MDTCREAVGPLALLEAYTHLLQPLLDSSSRQTEPAISPVQAMLLAIKATDLTDTLKCPMSQVLVGA